MGWYVAYCKPNCDHIAELNLQKQKLTVFRPLLKTVASAEIGKPSSSLFPRYLFIQERRGEPINFSAINSTRGVVRVITFGNHAPKLADELIDRFRKDQQLCVDDIALLRGMRPGDFVKVKVGELLTVGAYFHSMGESERVNVLLGILGHHRVITTHASRLQP